MTLARHEDWRCERCRKYAIVKMNGRPLCDKHFDEALKAQIGAVIRAWAAQGGDPAPWDRTRKPFKRPKVILEPAPKQEVKPEKEAERPSKPQRELF